MTSPLKRQTNKKGVPRQIMCRGTSCYSLQSLDDSPYARGEDSPPACPGTKRGHRGTEQKKQRQCGEKRDLTQRHKGAKRGRKKSRAFAFTPLSRILGLILSLSARESGALAAGMKSALGGEYALNWTKLGHNTRTYNSNKEFRRLI